MSSSLTLNILILGVQVPFTRGGAEELLDCLSRELKARGHRVDTVQLPFSALPKRRLVSQMALWRSLELDSFAGHSVDLLIPSKFPSYLVEHPRKVPWLVHQHRQLYDLYGGRYSDFTEQAEDEALRRLTYQADMTAFAECRKVFTIAANVSKRLERFLGIKSTPLLPPPPQLGRYKQGGRGDFILSVGRLCSIKRVDLILRALPAIDPNLKLLIAGRPDEPAIQEYLQAEVDKHHLWNRVQFLGRVSDEELLELYSSCFAVYYAPHDEDYGFVTLEARASAKPVITCTDSGSVLDFIAHEINGLISDPSESALAAAINRLYADQSLYTRLAFPEDPSKHCSSWEQIVQALLEA